MNNFYDNEKLEQLKAKSAFSMPDNPSNRGWSASQIKRTLYEPSLMLFEWAKENGVISEERYFKLKTQVDTNTIDIETLKTQVDEILTHSSFDIIELSKGPYFDYVETPFTITEEERDKIFASKFPVIKFKGSPIHMILVGDYGDYKRFTYILGENAFEPSPQKPQTVIATLVVYRNLNAKFMKCDLPNDLVINKNKLHLNSFRNELIGSGVPFKSINGEPILGVDGNIDLVQASEKAVPNGIATLGSDGKVLPAQLPDGIDEIIEGTLTSPIAFTDDKGKVWTTGTPDITHRIFVDTNTNKSYRWSGSQFTAIADDLSLGYTHETAFYGDEGKRNSDDIVSLKSQVNGNNFVRTTTQDLTKEQQDIVKTNLNVVEAGITASDDGNGTVNILNGGDPFKVIPNNGEPATADLDTLKIGDTNYEMPNVEMSFDTEPATEGNTVGSITITDKKTGIADKWNVGVKPATETALGGVKASPKTDNETAECKIDPVTHKLYAPAGGGGGDWELVWEGNTNFSLSEGTGTAIISNKETVDKFKGKTMLLVNVSISLDGTKSIGGLVQVPFIKDSSIGRFFPKGNFYLRDESPLQERVGSSAISAYLGGNYWIYIETSYGRIYNIKDLKNVQVIIPNRLNIWKIYAK